MTPIDRAVAHIKAKGFARTPDLAKILELDGDEVDQLLLPSRARGFFMCSDVTLGDGKKIVEYRLSVANGGKDTIFIPTKAPKVPDPIKERLREWRAPKPKAAPGQASAAPDKSPTSAPVPAAPARDAAHQENHMADKKPLAERVVEALKKHGPLGLDALAKHADTTKTTLYAMMGTFVKKNGVRRVRGERGVYEIGDSQPRQRVALAAGGELGRRKGTDKVNGNPYRAALDGLQARRSTLLAEITKVERAIEAVEALAA